MAVLTYLLLLVPILLIIGIVLAVKRQAHITRSFTAAEQAQDAKVYAESTKALEVTVAEALAAKAALRLLAQTSASYDPEIPLNIVDLGLIYEVTAGPDAVNVKMSMTSAACPSGAVIAEDVKVKLTDAGFPSPKVEVVWEPPWSPQRISEAGRKALGI